MRKKYLALIYTLLFIGSGLFSFDVYAFYKNSETDIKTQSMETEAATLTPVGQPIGIYVKTQGVLVVDTGSFTCSCGGSQSPSEKILYSGDYLTSMDGVAITGKKQIKEYVENGGGEEITFQISRQDELIQAKVTPQLDEKGVYKIGAWLRDSTQGIGTMTYIDDQNRFGALGHGINDMDTGELLRLGTGLLYRTDIVAVRRGEKGNPGELTGLIEYTPEQVSGVIESNTSKGIYGVANQELLSEYTKLESIPIASKQEVKTGQALLLCKIEEEAKYYEMEITKISTSSTTAINRRLSIRITDEELLALTGGIVQGMSGAPIIQNGKFVGAVTHVLVQDSSKGYGIFIEDMLPNR